MRFLPTSTLAGVSKGLAVSISPDSGRTAFFAAVFFTAFFAAFFATAFLAAFFAGFFSAGAFFATTFFAAAFLAPKPRRAGLPVSASSASVSSRVSEAGSRSLGILPLSLPSLM